MSEQIDAGRLQTLANRAVKRLGGKRPVDQTVQDAIQDAVLAILERWLKGERRDGHLVMYAWGRLKDKYARLFAHNARTQDESVYLRQVRAGKHHYIQEEHIPPRGSYGRTALFAPTPNDRIAPGSQDDARIDILEAVKSLTPLQQTVFTACVINGRLQTDVAAERGITRYAVLRILQRAKAKLRQLLGDYDE